MLIIIYPAIFILCFWLCLSFENETSEFKAASRAFLRTLVILTALGFFITEFLSAFDKISKGGIAASYFVVLGILTAVFVFKKGRPGFFAKIAREYRDLSREIKIGFCILFFVTLLPILASTLLYPPNNGDSLTYHLTRVEQWIQNKNVEYFPTYNTRQLFSQPLDEYLLLHLRLLSGHDRFLGLVQYAAMLGSAAAIALLAGLFGLSRQGRFIAAVLALTLPIGILEAGSTQNDYVMAFFFLAFLYFNLRPLIEKTKNERIFSDIIFGACSFGLGVLTKANFLVFALPLVVWFGIYYIIKFRRQAFSVFFVYLLITAAINAPYFYRNLNLTAYIFGDRAFAGLMTNDKISLANGYSNIIRNAGTQLAYPGRAYNFFLDRAVFKLHGIFGLDVNDPATTPSGTEYKTLAWIHEDYSSQPVFIIILLFCSVLFFFRFSDFDKRQRNNIAFFWICLGAGFVLFSFIFVWQPWQSRLLLPLLLAAAVFAAYPLALIFGSRKRVMIFIFLILVYAGTPYAFWNSKRSVAFLPNFYLNHYSKSYFYYYAHPELYQNFVDAAALIKNKNIKNIGLALGWNTLEYPLWDILKKEDRDTRIKNVVFPEYLKRVKNYDPDFSPEIIISTTAPADKFFFIEDEIADYLRRQDIKETLDFGYLKLHILKL